MRTALAIFIPFVLTSCATTLERGRPLDEFYRYAKARSAGRTRASPPALDNLSFTLSAIPGCGRYPNDDESSILVTDPNFPGQYGVQVIVTPRVSGSFLDPEGPTTEFLAELAQETRRALESSRYVAVSVCRTASRSGRIEGAGIEQHQRSQSDSFAVRQESAARVHGPSAGTSQTLCSQAGL